MIATVAGFVLLAIGALLAVAVAAAWRANLPEYHMLATAAIFGGYVLLPDGIGGTWVAVAVTALFLVSSGSAVQKLVQFRESFMSATPELVVLALSGTGLWLVWR